MTAAIACKDHVHLCSANKEWDVLFRLSSSTDPEVVEFLHGQPETLILLRYLKDAAFTEDEVKKLHEVAVAIKKPAKELVQSGR